MSRRSTVRARAGTLDLNMSNKLFFTTRLAQLVERMPFKPVVEGSSPSSGDSDETTIKVPIVLVAQLVRASVL